MHVLLANHCGPTTDTIFKEFLDYIHTCTHYISLLVFKSHEQVRARPLKGRICQCRSTSKLPPGHNASTVCWEARLLEDVKAGKVTQRQQVPMSDRSSLVDKKKTGPMGILRAAASLLATALSQATRFCETICFHLFPLLSHPFPTIPVNIPELAVRRVFTLATQELMLPELLDASPHVALAISVEMQQHWTSSKSQSWCQKAGKALRSWFVFKVSAPAQGPLQIPQLIMTVEAQKKLSIFVHEAQTWEAHQEQRD